MATPPHGPCSLPSLAMAVHDSSGSEGAKEGRSQREGKDITDVTQAILALLPDHERTSVAKHCRSDNVLASAARVGESVGLAVWEAVSGKGGAPGMFHDRRKELEKLVTEPGAFGHCALTYAAMRETRGLFDKMVVFLATTSCRKADEMAEKYVNFFKGRSERKLRKTDYRGVIDSRPDGANGALSDRRPVVLSTPIDDETEIPADILPNLKPDYRMLVLSRLMQEDPYVDETHLQALNRLWSGSWLRECCVGAVALAINPFIPGMILSVALSQAVKGAPEGERRALAEAQDSVDALLLEILERLPQTVHGFKAGMADCRMLFEPTINPETGEEILDSQTPLTVALQHVEHMRTFCTRTLLVDYMSLKFRHQTLPELMDAEHVLQDRRQLRALDVGGRVLLGRSQRARVVVALLTGTTILLEQRGQHEIRSRAPCCEFPGSDKLPSLTFLPGAQLISAMIAYHPSRYYDVPSLRMCFDFVVYIAMIALFRVSVVLCGAGKPMTPGEFVFGVYIVGAAWTEIGEMRSSPVRYFKNGWNVLDIWALLHLGAGFIVRLVDRSQPWGLGFYAFSAPLIFARLLFFAQVLPAQGPMVQVVFGMAAQLLQFAVVLVVIMMGFAMAFYALLRESSDVFGNTPGETWRGIFYAMLGDVSVFDEAISDDSNPYGSWILALFVIYLVITTIMLLNLLVAILTVQHEAVQENVEKEFKVSQAKVFEHFDHVVEKDILPAPLNMLQLGVAALWASPAFIWAAVTGKLKDGGGTHGKETNGRSEGEALGLCRQQATSSKRAEATYQVRFKKAARISGKYAFMVVIRVVAIIGGSFLWVVSTPLATAVVYAHVWCERAEEEMSWYTAAKIRAEAAYWAVLSAFLCIFAAPLYLISSTVWGSWSRYFHVAKSSLRLVGIDVESTGASSPTLAEGATVHKADTKRDGQANMDGGQQKTDESETARGISPPERKGEKNNAAERIIGNWLGEHLTVPLLREYLENPMNDPWVRQDEKTRHTTVKHIKLLRNRLEKHIAQSVKQNTDASMEKIKKQVDKVLALQTVMLHHLARHQSAGALHHAAETRA